MALNFKLEQAAEQAGIALSALAAALEREAERTAAESPAAPPQPEFSFRPVKTLREAAAIAEGSCGMWQIEGNTAGTRLGPEELMYACEQQDRRVTLEPWEEGKYYLVRPDGSIGITLDGCRSIDWIFLPA